MNREDFYIELSKENITFYGDTENEKKLSELLFDMALENDRLYKEILRLKEYIKRLENKVS